MNKVLVATGNDGKFKEIMESLGDLPLDFLSLRDLNLKNSVNENGATYKENAFIKADFFSKYSVPVISEDSGIEIEALEGELGIKTRRWGAGENASDEEWISYFLNRMKNEENRLARFCCHAVFLDKAVRKDFYGETLGTIEKEIRYKLPKGIPLSGLFVPSGYKIPFSEMTDKEKNSISHRGMAMKKLKSFLVDYFKL